MMSRHALTLAELVTVLCILTALGGLLVPLCSAQLTSAAAISTQHTLAEVRVALERYWLDTRLIQLDGIVTAAGPSDRFQLHWLSQSPVTGDTTNDFNPATLNGWNGPYLMHPASWDGTQFAIKDGWHNNLVVQVVDPLADTKDVRIISAGPDGQIDTPSATSTDALTANDVGDDVYVALLLR